MLFRSLRQRGQSLIHPVGHPGPGRPDGQLHAFTKGCLAGLSICFVSHRGDVQPCGYLPRTAGNVTTTPIARIWADSDLFNTIRDESRLTGRCGACEYKSLCGGCRARALAAHGDMMASEPCCTYVPAAMRPR
mgnify:CR=1 FL=1